MARSCGQKREPSTEVDGLQFRVGRGSLAGDRRLNLIISARLVTGDDGYEPLPLLGH
jgi:hypothetical protein